VTMRLALVNTATDGLNRGLGPMALEAFLRQQAEHLIEVARHEVSYPVPWWEPRPFDDSVLANVLAGEPDVVGLTLTCWDSEAGRDGRVRRPADRTARHRPTADGHRVLDDHRARLALLD
jgi:hypothetical protein